MPMKTLIPVLAALLGTVFAPAIRADEAAPAHESFTLDSAALAETRRINVYTPPDYAVRNKARYPVLYMPDGGMQEDFPHVAADIDAAIRTGQVRAMIVVGIENTQRRRDMTGPTEVDSDRKIAAQVGGSAAFRAFIANELMPQVRRRYRTDGHTAIVGESLAGLFVLETFFVQPQLFDTYIALSPSLWWNHEALVQGASVRLAAWPRASRTTLYVATTGDDGLEESATALQACLQAHAPRQLAWFVVPWPELHHADIYRRASRAVFRKLFGNASDAH